MLLPTQLSGRREPLDAGKLQTECRNPPGRAMKTLTARCQEPVLRVV